MTSNYRIEATEDSYTIIENNTGHTLEVLDNETEAYKRLSWFNMGGAFDGWTPEFVLKKVEINFDDDELDGE